MLMDIGRHPPSSLSAGRGLCTRPLTTENPPEPVGCSVTFMSAQTVRPVGIQAPVDEVSLIGGDPSRSGMDGDESRDTASPALRI